MSGEPVLRSEGQTVDELTTQLIVLTPVDDPPVKEGIVPIQEMDEDAGVVYNILDVVSDPEGEELMQAGAKTAEQSPIRYSIQGSTSRSRPPTRTARPCSRVGFRRRQSLVDARGSDRGECDGRPRHHQCLCVDQPFHGRRHAPPLIWPAGLRC